MSAEIEKKVAEYLRKNPAPKDKKQFHKFAETVAKEHGIAEETAYEMLGSILSGGKSKGDKKPVDPKELAMGVKVEMEHTDNKIIADKIARDHLSEVPDYYTRLAAMEKTALQKAIDKVEVVMKEFKEGKLKSSSGQKVTDRKQALAIAMSESGKSKKMKEDEETEEEEEKMEKANRQFVHIHGNLFMDMEKAATHKYIKRLPKSAGKGYIYFYNRQQVRDYEKTGKIPEQKEGKSGGILSGIMSFFGFKDEAKAREKVDALYSKNKGSLGVEKKAFADHLNEYLSNKDKWDAKFVKGQDKKGGESVPKKKTDKKEGHKSGVTSKVDGEKWDVGLMKKIAGIVQGEPTRGKSMDEKTMKGKPLAKEEIESYLEAEKKLNDANDRLAVLDPDSSEYKKEEKISDAMEKELQEQVDAATKSYGITADEFVDQINKFSEKKSDKSSASAGATKEGLKEFTIVDNDNPSRSVKIKAKDKNDAMDRGASELKTMNIRTYEKSSSGAGGEGGGKAPKNIEEFRSNMVKQIDEKIKKAEAEIDDAKKKEKEGVQVMLQSHRMNEARNFIDDQKDKRHWYSGGRGDERLKEEYRKAIKDKKELSLADKKMFPDLTAERLAKETGLNFYHDEETSGTGIRFSFDSQGYRINEIKENGLYEIGDNSGRMITFSEAENIKKDLKSISDKASAAAEEEAKFEKERSENIKSQGWQSSTASKEGFKLKMGKGFVDVSPKDIKKTFKVWGEDVFIIKSPEGGYSATEKKTGLKIGKGSNIEKTVENAKTVLATQSEKRFKDAIAFESKMSEAGKNPVESTKETEKTKGNIAPNNEFEKLPDGSKKAFNESWDGKDIKKMSSILHLGNKTLRKEFESRSGIKLPKTVKGTDEEIKKYFENQPLSKAVTLLTEELAKAKKMPIGTVNKKGYEKVAEGKWVKKKGSEGKKPDEKKPEKKPGKDEKSEKGGLDEGKLGIMKSVLKKVANILAEALSGKDVNAPTGAAVEQTGENIKETGKNIQAKKKADAQKKQEQKGKGK